ncbi:hypothetical protein B0I35DRAFT_427074 [Stachybotrys elegans]|uniref:Uncharacterized protein n=1 Tax=Stachybotrys elegans TaxID=80388 RepID=A0A8K0WUE4_9HYPO|nr:hypothetical protein B0I35DRAFT_427074 [Stachybotrys elegans]
MRGKRIKRPEAVLLRPASPGAGEAQQALKPSWRNPNGHDTLQPRHRYTQYLDISLMQLFELFMRRSIPRLDTTTLPFGEQRPPHPDLSSRQSVRSPLKPPPKQSQQYRAPKKPMFVSVPSKSERDHGKRKNLLSHILEPIIPRGSDEATVLICVGKGERCQIYPVYINVSNEKLAWEQIRDKWHSVAGWWWKFLSPLAAVENVSLVKVSIACRLPQRKEACSVFMGTYSKCDSEQELLEQKISTYEKAQEDSCTYNPSTNSTDHSWECEILNEFTSVKCTVDALCHAKRDLIRLSLLLRFFSLAISQPEIGTANNLLSRSHVFMSHRDVLAKLDTWHCPDVGELPFNGLSVDVSWTPHLHYILIPSIVSLLMLLVLGARLVYGDWDIAWAVGSFLIALISFFVVWTQHTT